MLMIDDNMYKLARMQESLLKVANTDYHLQSYVMTITAIDKNSYDELVNLIKEADKYNQTLEDEMIYLEKIKVAYDQLMELQMKFKNICEHYGKSDLELSDMSLLNIEYIENRMSAINGYLVNGKNIEKNKKRLEELNEQLVVEEKKRDFLNKKIVLLERKLKDDFVRASVKQIVFGKLENFDIVTEYDKLGYNMNDLINNEDTLNNKIKSINVQMTEISEKYETAKLCYNNVLNNDNVHIMEEIEKEFYTVKYKYVMLKVLKLLVQEVEKHELAKVKRQDFVNLLKQRNLCLEKLNIKNPLDILSFLDINVQLDDIKSLEDTIDVIHDIRSEISEITLKTEEMINQNNNYLISLNDTKEMIKSKVGFNDVDITTFDDIVEDEVKKQEVVLNNQVVRIRNLSPLFKINIATQKARGVIERVCKLNVKDVESPKSKKEYVPELVIGPKKEINSKLKEDGLSIKNPNVAIATGKTLENEVQSMDESPKNDVEITNIEILEPYYISSPLEVDVSEEKTLEPENTETIEENNAPVNLDIFETTTPFNDPVLFSDRADSEIGIAVIPETTNIEIQEESLVMPEFESDVTSDNVFEQSVEVEETMPDAFWVTEEDDPVEENVGLSFDEQIDALLNANNGESLVKKR